jgi:hypothetical protein
VNSRWKKVVPAAEPPLVSSQLSMPDDWHGRAALDDATFAGCDSWAKAGPATASPPTASPATAAVAAMRLMVETVGLICVPPSE